MRLIAGVAVVAVLLGACNGGSDDNAASTTTKVKRTTTTTAPPPVAPFTGLADPSGVSRTLPSLGIKVENTRESRPQTGLEHADVVWDEVVEGEITRFLAMYQSATTDVVGPVRSVRLTDPLIVWPVGGIFAYSGGAQYAQSAIEQAPVTLLTEGSAGDGMFRDSSKRAPHNLYARPDALWAKGGQPVPPPALFRYRRAGAASPGDPATSVRLGFDDYYAPTYTWDAANGAWLRAQGGGPHLMRSGAQIAPQNVVVMQVVYAGGVGAPGAEAQLVGSGPLFVFSDGKVVRGTWSRPDKAVPAELLDAAGAPIRLTPGKTWVELPDVSYAVDITSPPPPPPTEATTTTRKKKSR